MHCTALSRSGRLRCLVYVNCTCWTANPLLAESQRTGVKAFLCHVCDDVSCAQSALVHAAAPNSTKLQSIHHLFFRPIKRKLLISLAVCCLCACLQPAPVLVSMTHIPTSSGRVYDAAAVGAACRSAGVPFLLDACQSVGQVPIDVQHIQCDFLTGELLDGCRVSPSTGQQASCRQQWNLIAYKAS